MTVGNGNDMFRNKGSSSCPLDATEISEIELKLVDSGGADLAGNIADLITMNGSGDLEVN